MFTLLFALMSGSGTCGGPMGCGFVIDCIIIGSIYCVLKGRR